MQGGNPCDEHQRRVRIGSVPMNRSCTRGHADGQVRIIDGPVHDVIITSCDDVSRGRTCRRTGMLVIPDTPGSPQRGIENRPRYGCIMETDVEHQVPWAMPTIGSWIAPCATGTWISPDLNPSRSCTRDLLQIPEPLCYGSASRGVMGRHGSGVGLVVALLLRSLSRQRPIRDYRSFV